MLATRPGGQHLFTKSHTAMKKLLVLLLAAALITACAKQTVWIPDANNGPDYPVQVSKRQLITQDTTMKR